MTSSSLDLLSPAPDGWVWTVLHTRPRCEKKVVALAPLKEAEFFLPCTTRVHEYGNRKRTYELPLFVGYVFGKMPKEHISWYRGNQYVANMIPVVHEEKFLAPLRTIASALASGLEMEVLPDMTPGAKVQITAGPLKGLETEIHEVAGDHKVIIQLEMIQKSVSIEVEVSHLKRIL